MKSKIEEQHITYEWLKLLSFVIISARGCVEEQKIHGPFRLVDTAERIITQLDNEGRIDEFLTEEREKIKENKNMMMYDEEGFIRFLDELVIDFSKRLKEGPSR